MEEAEEFGARQGLSWCVHRRRPPRVLRRHVLGLAGYEERSEQPLERDELPGPSAVLIVELGPPLTVDGLTSSGDGGFVAGPMQSPVRCEHSGYQAGIQVDLSTASLRALFGVPARELEGRVLSLDEFPSARTLKERLRAGSSWPDRLKAVENWLQVQLDSGPEPDPRVVYAEHRLREMGGQVLLSDLREEVELSERRFTRLFQSELGVSPKRFAELARFDRARTLLQERHELPLADVALESGYCDQSHLSREVKRFSGLSPGHLRRGGNEVFVEDAPARNPREV